MFASEKSISIQSPTNSDEVVTIGLYCPEENIHKFDIKTQIKQIEHIRKQITDAAISMGKKPPRFILSVLLVPDWTKEDNGYENKHYAENQGIFFTKIKEQIENAKCGYELQDAYESASKVERGYLNQLRNMGANADWIKTHAIIANQKVKHLQLDTNTQISDYSSFYAHTFGQDKHDALNASAYDENSAYVSAHNKVVYTVPTGKIAQALDESFFGYCKEHQDPRDPDKNNNSIYSKVFCPSLAKIDLTIHKSVKDPIEGAKDRYLVNFNQPEYELTQDIITAVNMSWTKPKPTPDPYAPIKNVPGLKYLNAEITFPCFINLINVHTAPFLWHADRSSVDKFRNEQHNREKDIAIIRQYYQYIAKNRPDLINLLVRPLAIRKNLELAQTFCKDAFGVTPDVLERIANKLVHSKEALLIKFKHELEDALVKTFQKGKGLGKDPTTLSEQEQIRLTMLLSLQENKQGFDIENNRFKTDLGLNCQNVLGDGFCFFRAIAKQITDRDLNIQRNPQLEPLPTTMEGVLEKVAAYFNEHSEELMDRVFPPPNRIAFGNGAMSAELYQKALAEHNNLEGRKTRLNHFKDNFYEYINLGRYDFGGQSINAADWLPQVMSDVLKIDIDIYDGQRSGGGLRTNKYQQRIGLGRVNNNHYISLEGNLDIAWLKEQQAIQDHADQLQEKSFAMHPLVNLYLGQQAHKSQSLLASTDFMLQQLVHAKKIGEYVMHKIEKSQAKDLLQYLNEAKAEVRQEVFNALQPSECEALWKIVENLEGHETLKAELSETRGKFMQVVIYDPEKSNKLK